MNARELRVGRTYAYPTTPGPWHRVAVPAARDVARTAQPRPRAPAARHPRSSDARRGSARGPRVGRRRRPRLDLGRVARPGRPAAPTWRPSSRAPSRRSGAPAPRPSRARTTATTRRPAGGAVRSSSCCVLRRSRSRAGFREPDAIRRGPVGSARASLKNSCMRLSALTRAFVTSTTVALSSPAPSLSRMACATRRYLSPTSRGQPLDGRSVRVAGHSTLRHRK